MWAILSDIHGNLEALEAVLADADGRRVERILCLGDLVGYGPNPRECIDLVRSRCAVTLLGACDQAALFDPEAFSPFVLRSILLARAQIEEGGAPEGVRRRQFLAALPRTYHEHNLLFVHGTPRNPLSEYLYPEHVHEPRKMEPSFALIGHYCFAGHTHVPGVFIDQAVCVDPRSGTARPVTLDRLWSFHSPEEIDHVYRLDERKALINVGSVGQPRDDDPRACYVLLANDRVHFRRVGYDVETTVRKIYAVAELENVYGDRLRQGR
jgi:predicted phosphodiesterase